MCGILGVVAPDGHEVRVGDRRFDAMLQRMTARGPDDVGTWSEMGVRVGVRRLAISGGVTNRQPASDASGRWIIAFNGAIYDLPDLLRDLEAEGWIPPRDDDVSALATAVAAWGVARTVERIRGMFALAAWDRRERRLVLARDPLGMKPLYHAATPAGEVVFASHLPALLGHPDVSARPDAGTISAYLTSIHAVTATRTPFRDVAAVPPATVLTLDLGPDAEPGPPVPRLRTFWREPWHPDPTWHDGPIDPVDAAGLVRSIVEESIRLHGITEPQTGSALFLSGGLDSALLAGTLAEPAALARPAWTATGDEPDPTAASDVSVLTDREGARSTAASLGLAHDEVTLDAASFDQGWRELVEHVGLPLSTPNEVAMYALARAARAGGTKVVLTGEGADEFFGGYAGPTLCALDGMRTSAPEATWPGGAAGRRRYRRELRDRYGTTDLGHPMTHHWRCQAWIHPGDKPVVLTDEVLADADHDAALVDHWRTEHEAAASATSDPGAFILLMQRRLNLTGLLRRLDTATMAAGIESRTPFADVRVAECAARLPFEWRLAVAPDPTDGGWNEASVALGRGSGVTPKWILRRAWEGALSSDLLDRPKTSFPLPFQRWLVRAATELDDARRSPIREWIRPEVLAAIREDPAARWTLAWPVLNLDRWLRAWAA